MHNVITALAHECVLDCQIRQNHVLWKKTDETSGLPGSNNIEQFYGRQPLVPGLFVVCATSLVVTNSWQRFLWRNTACFSLAITIVKYPGGSKCRSCVTLRENPSRSFGDVCRSPRRVLLLASTTAAVTPRRPRSATWV